MAIRCNYSLDLNAFTYTLSLDDLASQIVSIFEIIFTILRSTRTKEKHFVEIAIHVIRKYGHFVIDHFIYCHKMCVFFVLMRAIVYLINKSLADTNQWPLHTATNK